MALYHFKTKDDLVAGVTTKVMTDAATAMLPAIMITRLLTAPILGRTKPN